MKNASFDSSNNIFLVSRDEEGYNIDKFFKEYFRGRKRKRSLDFLYIDNNNKKYFIEFKNSRLGNIKPNEMHEKIASTVIVYLGEKYDTLSEMRNNSMLILVVKNYAEKIGAQIDLGSMQGYERGSEDSAKNINYVLSFYKNFTFKDARLMTPQELGGLLDRL